MIFLTSKAWWAGLFVASGIGGVVSYLLGDPIIVGTILAPLYYAVADRILSKYLTGSWFKLPEDVR
jgi:hypothetical protein